MSSSGLAVLICQKRAPSPAVFYRPASGQSVFGNLLCTTPLCSRARSSFWWSLSAYAHHISLGKNTTFPRPLANYLPVRNAPPPAFSSTLQVPSLAVVLNPRPRLCFWRSMSPTYTTSPAQPVTDTSLSALLASQQMNGHPQSMDARQQDYAHQAPLKQEYSQQPGLNSPYASSSYTGNLSETLSSPDQNQAAQYHSDVRQSLCFHSANLSCSLTRLTVCAFCLIPRVPAATPRPAATVPATIP